ncbi:MAG: nucleotide-binding enzyme [Myxococcales bacterium]|nr:nucleotide-binding enzyme [Myxococcales bacterium]
MAREGPGGLRAHIAAEAARLMYEEEVKQYFTAKHLAARRILGRVEGRRLRFRPQDLPSNGEIRDALDALARRVEGPPRETRLAAMRLCALVAMRALAPFRPRLIGSVSTGHIRRQSDIDLHVFTDALEALEAHLAGLGWRYTLEHVSIIRSGKVCAYTHAHVEAAWPLELTAYPTRDLRHRPRSSTDGKPIVRRNDTALEALIAAEHPLAWARFCHDGFIDPCDDADAPFDDLVCALDDALDPALAPRPDEVCDDDAPYEPLAGFEDL